MTESSKRWRTDGVRIIRSDELDDRTAQTLGMQRRAAVTTERTGATKLWAGTVTIDQGIGAVLQTPEQFLEFIKQEIERYREIILSAKIQAE